MGSRSVRDEAESPALRPPPTVYARRGVLVLALDTATDVATVALVWDGELLGESASRPATVLEDVDAVLRRGGIRPGALEGLVVGTGPGSFTGLRMGLAAARALAFALDVPAAGVSTLSALALGAAGSLPVLDARRREVFTLVDGEPRALAPGNVPVEPGRVLVGDGAVRYREAFEAAGAVVPPDGDGVHVPHARHHAALATGFGPAEEVEPIYVRLPDAEQALRRAADVP